MGVGEQDTVGEGDLNQDPRSQIIYILLYPLRTTRLAKLAGEEGTWSRGKVTMLKSVPVKFIKVNGAY